MSELDDLLANTQDGLRNVLGEEGLEQLNLDDIWLQQNFQGELLKNLEAMARLQGVGAGGIYVVNSSFLGGMYAYRSFMIGKGVDVLALEERV